MPSGWLPSRFLERAEYVLLMFHPYLVNARQNTSTLAQVALAM